MAKGAMPVRASPGELEVSDRVVLPAISDAGAAGALKEALSPLVLRGASIRLAGEEVERITTPCVQVLLAADRALAPRQAGLVLKGPSEAMRLAFAELGLGAELERWVAANG
jgi:anti-anti-sigma regulatory factor